MEERALSFAMGAVLAGGRGSRLGGAKATVELAGKPLIAYPITALAEAGIEPVVVAKRGSEMPPLPCRTVWEPEEPRHPLAGLVAALRGAADRPLIAVACDMPFLAPALLAHLAAAAEPLVLPEPDAELHPFPGRYETSLLPALEGALEAGEPLRRTLARLGPRRLDADELGRFGPPEHLLFNVNTPTDLERARRLPPRSPSAR
jgi:molybdopterin-guanine dinucleotide biosynthesis protein A